MVTVATLDRATAAQVEDRFQQDLDLSEEVTLDAWKRRGLGERLWDWIAYRLLSL